MRLIWKVVCLICSGVMEQEYRRFASSILYLRKFWEGRGAEGTAEGLEPRYVRLRVRWFFCQRRGGMYVLLSRPRKASSNPLQSKIRARPRWLQARSPWSEAAGGDAVEAHAVRRGRQGVRSWTSSSAFSLLALPIGAVAMLVLAGTNYQAQISRWGARVLISCC